MYNVHMNGSKIAETEANQHVVTGVEQGKEHEFAVDKAGNGVQTVKIFVPYPALNVNVDKVTFNGAEFSWTPPAGASNIKYYVILIDDVEVARVSGVSNYNYTGHTPNKTFTLTIYFETLDGHRSNSYNKEVTTLPLTDLTFVVEEANLTSSTVQVKVNKGPFTNDIVSVVLNGGTSDNITPEQPFVKFINLTSQTEYTLTGFYIRNFGLATEQRHTIPALKFTTL